MIIGAPRRRVGKGSPPTKADKVVGIVILVALGLGIVVVVVSAVCK